MDDPFDVDPDLAAQMGFASFGSQPTAKKRKYNPAADAVTSSSPSSLPQKPPPPQTVGGNTQSRSRDGETGGWQDHNGKGARHGGRGGGRAGWRDGGMESSGSNTTPLGVRTGRGKERDGGGDEEGGFGGGVLLESGHNRPAAHNDEEEDGDDDMPTYIDATPPDSPLETPLERSSVQDPIDGTMPHTLQQSAFALPAHLLPAPVHTATNAGPDSLTLRAQATQSEGSERSGQSAAGARDYNWAALRRGVRNERGDVAYYDRSFVEDPWAGLLAGKERMSVERG